MNTITLANIRDFVVNGSWKIAGEMKPDKDSDNVKHFTLNVKYHNVPVLDIINKSLEPTKISWVNAQGRKHFAKWTNRQTIDIDFKSPAKAYVDPEAEMVAKLRAMAPEERAAYLAKLTAEFDENEAE